MYTLKGGKVFINGTFQDLNLKFSDSIIGYDDCDGAIVDVTDKYIVPGFIDLQVNGCGGYLFNSDISEECVNELNNTNIKYGCMGFLPTLITSPYADIEKALNLISKVSNPNVLGIHLEGPFINEIKKGTHNKQHIITLNSQIVDMLVYYAKKNTILLTLAPECNKDIYIKKLLDAGIKISIGHSLASYQEAKDAINLGVTSCTHLYNAMSGYTARNTGIIGMSLQHEHVFSGIICDGLHVHYEAIEIAYKLKNKSLYIVTDSVTPAGTDIKQFTFADKQITVNEQGMCVDSNGVLSGANITMIESIRNLYNYTNIPLEGIITMATTTPSAVIQNSNIGNLNIGSRSNINILDKDLTLLMSYNNGVRVL